jgi:glycolate oxidase FAD binding subunit
MGSSVHGTSASTLSASAETDLAAAHVDGLSPRFVASPTTEVAVAEALALADAQGWSVVPRRGGTKMDLGNVPRSVDAWLDLRGLSGIVDYTPADLTVTVLAGTPLTVLHGTLAEHGQMVALDPPQTDGASIGGILASNDSGPRRLAYGTARDLVIGMRVATPDGRLTRSGGKVVKNVTGYDLHKLHIGGLGTLGAIVEVSFKLHPIPRQIQTVVATFADCAHGMQAALRLIRSPLDPLSIVQVSEEHGWTLMVEHAGTPAALSRKADDTMHCCREAGASSIFLRDAPSREDWVRLWTAEAQGGARIKVSLRPTLLADYCTIVRSEATAVGVAGGCVLFAGNGLLFATLAGVTVETLATVIGDLRARAEALGGSLVLQRAPVEVKRLVDVWGRIPDGLSLMRKLKQVYDPHSILNPGRYVGGI